MNVLRVSAELGDTAAATKLRTHFGVKDVTGPVVMTFAPPVEAALQATHRGRVGIRGESGHDDRYTERQPGPGFTELRIAESGSRHDRVVLRQSLRHHPPGGEPGRLDLPGPDSRTALRSDGSEA